MNNDVELNEFIKYVKKEVKKARALREMNMKIGVLELLSSAREVLKKQNLSHESAVSEG